MASMPAPRIIQIEISSIPRPKPLGLFDPMPVVSATFDDGSTKELFSFYPDEIRFDEGELVGLTEQQARDLYRIKGIAFLRKPETSR
jgi:hypothetical protein